MVGCSPSDSRDSVDWIPDHFPVLSTDVATAEEIELGRWLFYDVRLSRDGTRSCGICHKQNKSFSDGLTRGLGIEETPLSLNSISLINVAWRSDLTWFQKIESIEEHMKIPLFGTEPLEMGMTEDLIISRLRESADYKEMFTKAFPESEDINIENTILAITAFTKTITSGNSAYDLWLRGERELAPESQRGMALFFGDRMKCYVCHGGIFFDQPDASMTEGGQRHGYFNTGLYNIDNQGSYPPSAQGLIERTGRIEDMGKFRIPSLRNLKHTKPWMHDGSEIFLSNILLSYARGGRKLEGGAFVGDGRDNPFKSNIISGFEISTQEQEDILSFLDSLNDDTILEESRLQSPFCIRREDEIINHPCQEPFIFE